MISLTHPTPYKMVTFLKLECSLEPLSTDTFLNMDMSLLWIVYIRISLYSKKKFNPLNTDTLLTWTLCLVLKVVCPVFSPVSE